MPLLRLDHVNLRTAQLAHMIEWYTRVLGMGEGERPDFPFAGAWMYVGDAPAVHLVAVEGAAGAEAQALQLEHFAFSATGLSGFLADLEADGIRYRRSELPSAGLVQINLWDPDGNHIHVDFRTDE